MVRVITQETFNDIVKENIEELDMNPEEAVQEAVEQLKAQGVDLSNIVKEVMNVPGETRNKLKSCIENLRNLIKSSEHEDEIASELKVLKEECDKSVAHRVFAGTNDAYNILVDILEQHQSKGQIVLLALNAQIGLMNGNPDLLDMRGVEAIISFLDAQENEDVQMKVLEWTRICCKMHERNRQNIFAKKILIQLKNLLDRKNDSPGVVKNVCAVIRALTLDDDIRVPFGKAHEHARELAVETLPTLTDLLQKYRSDQVLASAIIQTLTALIVRNEFCQKVEDVGGLTFVMDVFVQFPESEKLNKHCLKLVKCLAGNDDVKVHIVQKGIGPLIVSSMHRYEHSSEVVGAGCAAIAALCMRCEVNGKALYDIGAPEVILQGMIIHEKDSDVQRQGSWSVRNMVSRDKSLCDGFLKLGAEEILKTAFKNHGETIGFDVKAALRDLDCDIGD